MCKILVLPKPRYLTDVKSFLIKFSFAGKLCVKCFERVTAEKEIKFIYLFGTDTVIDYFGQKLKEGAKISIFYLRQDKWRK